MLFSYFYDSFAPPNNLYKSFGGQRNGIRILDYCANLPVCHNLQFTVMFHTKVSFFFYEFIILHQTDFGNTKNSLVEIMKNIQIQLTK